MSVNESVGATTEGTQVNRDRKIVGQLLKCAWKHQLSALFIQVGSD